MTNIAPDNKADLLGHLLEAIDALPYPFSLYDADSRLLACSRVYREQNRPAFLDLDTPVINGALSLRDVLEARYAEKYEPADAARMVATELARWTDFNRQDEDIKNNDEWMRCSQRVTRLGSVVEIAFSVDDWVQRSRALLEAKRALEHQAYHDPLTNLPNRRAMTEHIGRIVSEPRAGLFDIAFLHVDLDKFKAVNDTLGHDAGDCVIQEAGKILLECTRESDLVARIGGDEFVVICHAVSDLALATGIAERIVEKMSEPIPYGEEYCQIGASVGIALCADVRDLKTAMTDADIALYEAKRKGRGCYEVFAPHYRHKYTARQRQIAAVTAAVNFEAFEPYFQPQFCAKTGAFLGAEALARWIERERGVLEPRDFSMALEDLDLSRRIDAMILRKSLDAMAEWDKAGVHVPRICVNLSAHQLSSPEVVDRIKWAVECAGVAPSRVGLEIRESVVGNDDAAVVSQSLRALSEAGFFIALDNFGTGRSSISGLKTLPLDSVKIDRRFCMGISQDPELRMITTAMMGLVRNLGLSVCCEGIEATADRDVIDEIGCDTMQGFLLGKPMAADVFGRWVIARGVEAPATPALKRTA